MSERAAELALARGGRLLGRSAARDIGELAHLETQRWASINERLSGPTAMAGRNLSDLAANADPGTTDALQSGVIGPGDFLVSAGVVTSATGAFSATVAGGVSWVPDANGLLRRVVRAGSGVVNFGIPPGLPAAGSTRTYTLTVDSSGNFAIVAAAASVVGNVAPNGLNFLPGNGSMALANVAIINSAGTYQLAGNNVNWIQGVNWIDRRPWARGAFWGNTRFTNAAGGNDYTIPNVAWTIVDAANLQARLELSGAPLEAVVSGSWFAAASSQPSLSMTVDGFSTSNNGQYDYLYNSNGGNRLTFTMKFHWPNGIGAGSHLFALWGACQPAANNLVLSAQANIPLIVMVRELVRQNASNGTA